MSIISVNSSSESAYIIRSPANSTPGRHFIASNFYDMVPQPSFSASHSLFLCEIEDEYSEHLPAGLHVRF
eukprot:11160167-Lingulodinium_polyedra.AAC.1